MPNDPSGRVQVVGLGELLEPGACMICGSGNCTDGYVALGVFIDYLGNAYLCMNCAVQIIHVLEALMPAEAAHLIKFSEGLAEELRILRTESSDLRERLLVFDRALSTIRANEPKPAPVSGLPSEDRDPNLIYPSGGSAQGESVTEESVTEQGRNDAELIKLGDTGPGITI